MVDSFHSEELILEHSNFMVLSLYLDVASALQRAPINSIGESDSDKSIIKSICITRGNKSLAALWLYPSGRCW